MASEATASSSEGFSDPTSSREATGEDGSSQSTSASATKSESGDNDESSSTSAFASSTDDSSEATSSAKASKSTEDASENSGGSSQPEPTTTTASRTDESAETSANVAAPSNSNNESISRSAAATRSAQFESSSETSTEWMTVTDFATTAVVQHVYITITSSINLSDASFPNPVMTATGDNLSSLLGSTSTENQIDGVTVSESADDTDSTLVAETASSSEIDEEVSSGSTTLDPRRLEFEPTTSVPPQTSASTATPSRNDELHSLEQLSGWTSLCSPPGCMVFFGSNHAATRTEPYFFHGSYDHVYLDSVLATIAFQDDADFSTAVSDAGGEFTYVSHLPVNPVATTADSVSTPSATSLSTSATSTAAGSPIQTIWTSIEVAATTTETAKGIRPSGSLQSQTDAETKATSNTDSKSSWKSSSTFSPSSSSTITQSSTSSSSPSPTSSVHGMPLAAITPLSIPVSLLTPVSNQPSPLPTVFNYDPAKVVDLWHRSPAKLAPRSEVHTLCSTATTIPQLAFLAVTTHESLASQLDTRYRHVRTPLILWLIASLIMAISGSYLMTAIKRRQRA